MSMFMYQNTPTNTYSFLFSFFNQILEIDIFHKFNVSVIIVKFNWNA